MSTLILLAFIVVVMCWVDHNENVSENKMINTMVEADLKAERKRGDILSQGRRGNYR